MVIPNFANWLKEKKKKRAGCPNDLLMHRKARTKE